MFTRISALLVLASTMALGQAGNNSATPQNGQPGTSGLTPIQQTLRGCLRQSGGRTMASRSRCRERSQSEELCKSHL